GWSEPEERAPGPSSEKVDTGTHWVSIELVDEADRPVVGEPVIVRLPQGERTQEVRSSLDARGTLRIEGLKRAGACSIRFPALDLAAWQRWTGKAPPPAAGASTSPPPAEEGPVPAGSTTARGEWRTVRQGECLSSIAADTGLFWDTLWNHPANAELKRRRGDPNILFPGDAVFVPERRPKEETGNTDQHHKFMRRGEPHWLDVKLLRNGEPRANEPYTLEAGGEQRTGTTDAQGRIHEPLRGNARRATLTVGSDVYRFVLGGVDPLNKISGVQQRLNNLGFACGPADGQLGPRTLAALNLFRQHVGLPPSQELDDATRAKLNEVHDRMAGATSSADAVDEVEFESYGLRAADLDTTEAPDQSGPVT
ncbi:MAG TPA: peptidoglycan-binding domain-containing protein, partial [Phycisphaerae bacterium]|nr:peptidoglycan-binding domain-containing protein [Phycisphaerae bacterium]